MAKLASKNDILKTVSILEMAQDVGLDVESISSGNFDYRCKCPSKEHKGGNERTGSCYIDSQNNNFYCFGCGGSSNVIDFYMLIHNMSFSEAFHDLRPLAIPSGEAPTFLKKQSNFPTLVEISELFRKQMLLHPSDLKWITNVMKKTDRYLESIESEDVKKAKALLKSLKKTFKKRYST